MNNYIPPALSKSIHIEEVFNENDKKIFFVLDTDLPSWVFINEDGLEILRLCDGKNTIEKIAHRIAKSHEKIKPKDSLGIVDSFLHQMKQSSILFERDQEAKNDNQFRGLALEITKQCNLRCIHCYLSGGELNPDNTELSLVEIKSLLGEIVEVGGISVALGGGEPLIRKDCIDIIEHAASLNLLITLGTNATLIDQKIAQKLSDLPVKIQVSLDGATKGVHDSIRGPGSFDAAVRGIDCLIEEGMSKDIVIAFTPMKQNVKEVHKIIEFALNLEIPVVQFPPLSPSGRAKQRWEDLRLSSNQMLEFWEVISRKSEKLSGKMDLFADCFSLNIDNPGIPHRCTIGTQLRVGPYGNVYPCQCFHFGKEYCLGNIRNNTLKEIVYNQRIQKIKETCFQRPLKIEECRECKWRNFCGSGCMGNVYERTGGIHSPESCEVRKKWLEKLFEAKFAKIRL